MVGQFGLLSTVIRSGGLNYSAQRDPITVSVGIRETHFGAVNYLTKLPGQTGPGGRQAVRQAVN